MRDAFEERLQCGARRKMGVGDFAGARGVARVICRDGVNRVGGLFDGAIGEETFAGWKVGGEAGVLDDGGASSGEIAFGTVAEPGAVGADVGVFGDAEFG